MCNRSFKKTPFLKIEGPKIEDSGINGKYTYTVTYDPAKYYDSNYKKVYNVLIKIYEKENKNKVNEIKVSVNIDDLNSKKVESGDSEAEDEIEEEETVSGGD